MMELTICPNAWTLQTNWRESYEKGKATSDTGTRYLAYVRHLGECEMCKRNFRELVNGERNAGKLGSRNAGLAGYS